MLPVKILLACVRIALWKKFLIIMQKSVYISMI